MHASSLSSRTELHLWCNGSVLDRRFKPRSSQTKDNKFGICFLSTTHAALRSKSKYFIGSESDQRVRVELNVYLRPMISVRWNSNNPTERVGLVQIGHHHSNTIQSNFFSQWKIANLGDKHHSHYPYFSDGCTIPAILQSASWDYDFDSTTATLQFTSSGMTGLPFTARGEVLNTYDCIANKDDVYVFK